MKINTLTNLAIAAIAVLDSTWDRLRAEDRPARQVAQTTHLWDHFKFTASVLGSESQCQVNLHSTCEKLDSGERISILLNQFAPQAQGWYELDIESGTRNFLHILWEEINGSPLVNSSVQATLILALIADILVTNPRIEEVLDSNDPRWEEQVVKDLSVNVAVTYFGAPAELCVRAVELVEVVKDASRGKAEASAEDPAEEPATCQGRGAWGAVASSAPDLRSAAATQPGRGMGIEGLLIVIRNLGGTR